MSKPVSSSAALPIAYVVLRILVVVNWIGGAIILALLLATPNEQWIMTSFSRSVTGAILAQNRRPDACL